MMETRGEEVDNVINKPSTAATLMHAPEGGLRGG